MATVFETSILKTANTLIDQFGQYVAILSQENSLISASKPWEGNIKNFTGVTLKTVSKTVDENLLNLNDARMKNVNREFIIAGDKLVTVNPDDLIFTFDQVLQSIVTLPPSNINTNTTISTSGVYNIDSTAGDITLTLDQNNADKAIIFISKNSKDSNSIIMNTSGAVTILGKTTYTNKFNASVAGFILNGTNYEQSLKNKIYDIKEVSPSGNNLLYKLLVGA